MKFLLKGNWYYAPVIFEESDIKIALVTALNIEGDIKIWNEETKKWDFLYIPWGNEEENKMFLEEHGVTQEMFDSLSYKKSRSDVLFCKTDDYFELGAGVIDLTSQKIRQRRDWETGSPLSDCKFSVYGLDLKNGKYEIVNPKSKRLSTY